MHIHIMINYLEKNLAHYVSEVMTIWQYRNSIVVIILL